MSSDGTHRPLRMWCPVSGIMSAPSSLGVAPSPSRDLVMSAYDTVQPPPLSQALVAAAIATPTGAASLPRPSPPRRSSRQHRPNPIMNIRSFESSTHRSKKRSRGTSSNPSSVSKRRRGNLKKPPPPAAEHIDAKPMAKEDGDQKPSAVASAAHTCTICMCEPDHTEVASIDGCEHLYCFACIDKWSERENTCPNCKSRFTQIRRLAPQRKKSGSATPSIKNTKRVKQRDQRSDLLNGAALESILATLTERAGARESTVAQLGRFRVFAARVSAASRQSNGPMIGTTLLGGFGDNDDDDDEEFGGFMNAILRSAGTLNSNLRNHAYAMHAVRAPRSHATNEDDITAGRVAENPLEISDDDDDDEVEVIDVVTSTM